MVSSRWRLELEFPILSPAGEARVIRRTQQLATNAARRRIVRPAKPSLPVKTGELKKSFRARRPRRPRSRGYFVGIRLQFLFYLHFQRVWDEGGLRERIRSEAGEIITQALAQAMLEEE